MAGRREIYLGFTKILDQTDAVSVERHYLPLGKVGGKPAWLNPVALPSHDQLTCRNCKSPMPFLLQIYCSGKEDHAFHRYIYVFICSNPECYKESIQTVRVFRCQLPLKNDYIAEQKINFEQEGEVPDPCYNEEIFKKLCAVCGCHATKSCSKCRATYYCCVDHQKIDWKRHECNPKRINNEHQDTDSYVLRKANEFIFKEHAMEMDYDYAINVANELENESDEDDNEEDDDDDVVERARKQIEDLKVNGQGQMDSLLDLDETKDVHYKIFTKALKRDPTQILRYDRHGTPLSATDHSFLPKKIPDCPNCKAPRSFEFQITPHILSEIEERGSVSPIDFATILVFTCSADCEILGSGYVEEYAFKQDFKMVDEGKPCEDDIDDEKFK